MVFVIVGRPLQHLIEFCLGDDTHFPEQLKPLAQSVGKAVFHGACHGLLLTPDS